MDTCPTEVVTLIVECACSSDFGQTARSIGLVSKFFQAIAKPIELRTIAVAGLKQLQSAIERIRSLKVSHSSEVVDVRHLFICELRGKHAIAADVEFRNIIDDYLPRSSFWRTRQGVRAEASYRENSDEFWKLAGDLVKDASPNLETLFLLASENWLAQRGSTFRSVNPKALGVLSGVTFPSLVSLTVNHDASVEIASFVENGSLFQIPVTPSLRRLHIKSPIFLSRMYDRDQDTPEEAHPLLDNVRSQESKIIHLVVCEDRMWTAERAMKTIFGVDWRDQLQTGTLPGELQSVILEQGIMPKFGCGTGFRNYKLWTQQFVDTIAGLNVDGLEAHFPTPIYPEAGKREYELLLSEWKGEILAFRQ
ncbi:hypothetical protein ACEPAG_1259 [Sanghuangporus baumii]